MFAEQSETERVNRPARDQLRALAQHRLQTIRDLLGRAIGERHRADAVRIDTGGDQVLDPSDETKRLPRARSRDDEHRAQGRFDRAALLGQGSESHERSIGEF